MAFEHHAAKPYEFIWVVSIMLQNPVNSQGRVQSTTTRLYPATTTKFPPIEHGDRTPAPGKLGRQTDRQTDRHQGTLADPIGFPTDGPAVLKRTERPNKSKQAQKRPKQMSKKAPNKSKKVSKRPKNGPPPKKQKCPLMENPMNSYGFRSS